MKKISKRAKKQILNLLFVGLLIGITVTVLLLNNKELNLENIATFFTNCDPVFMAAAFLCMVLSIFFEGLSLHIIARRFGHRRGLHASVAYASADIYYSAITPSASGGQPASVFYMARDGMSVGKATFSLIFNLIGYAAAILILGAAAFIINPAMFGEIEPWFAHFLIILGLSLQTLLLGFCIACMFCGGAVIKLGNGLISLLNKIKIVKRPDKLRTKLAEEVKKYSNCRKEIAGRPLLFITTLLFNLLQRLTNILISCFVCLSAHTAVPFADLFVMQVFVLLGYNCVPLPGGTGAFEYLYLNIYCLRFDDAFIVVAMMVSRVISYYFCIVASGVYTLAYHIAGGRHKNERPQAQPDSGDSATAENADTGD